MTKSTKWTVVQHTGFVRGGDSSFQRSIESRALTNRTEERKVEAAGGVLFDGYTEAEDFCEAENYQADNGGLVPLAPGTFSMVRLEDCPIYVPLPKRPFDDFMRQVLDFLPNAEVHEDHGGQLVIYTGLKATATGDGVVVEPMTKEAV